MISSTGSSSNAVDYTSLQKSINSLSTEKMFRKLSGKSDDENSVISKNKTANDENPIGNSDSNSDNTQLTNNGIIRDDSASNVTYIKTKTTDAKSDGTAPHIQYGAHTQEEEFYYDGKTSPAINSFDYLAAEIGAIGDKISKQQLTAYLQSLTSDGASVADNGSQIAFVKNLIAKFDTLSGGNAYITSLTGIDEPQDYKTVTPEQVTPPFDLRI